MKSGVVTAVHRDSKDQNRYQIYVDGEWAFTVHEEVLVAFGLRKGAMLDEETWNRVPAMEAENEAYLTALRYLGTRPRTGWQLEQYLVSRGVPETLAHAVRARCERQGYVDDRSYARQWVAQRLQHNPRGRALLRMELHAKGIDQTVIHEVLGEINQQDELAAARRQVGKLLKRQTFPLGAKEEQKILLALLRKGFSHEIVQRIRRELRQRQPGREE